VLRWVVSDHLGTPRMTADLSGNLAGIRRHDYLPFGEEIGAGVGGRTTGQDYSQSDGVRQKFAGTERDGETGLDFMQARYYSPTQGRFASPDEFKGGPDGLYSFAAVASANPTFYAELTRPQSLNKYPVRHRRLDINLLTAFSTSPPSLQQHRLLHSYLSAISGSTFVARLAGR
jgi:RHS repeat-associated protein